MKSFRVNLKSETYLIVNLVIAGVISLIMIYSGIFSPEKDNYPVTCIHEKITGMECVSCGLSHSFSLMVRGRFNEAVEWNRYGPVVFMFFTAQLIMRIAFSFLYIRFKRARHLILSIDIPASAIMLVIAFLPFIKYIFNSLLLLI